MLLYVVYEVMDARQEDTIARVTIHCELYLALLTWVPKLSFRQICIGKVVTGRSLRREDDKIES